MKEEAGLTGLVEDAGRKGSDGIIGFAGLRAGVAERNCETEPRDEVAGRQDCGMRRQSDAQDRRGFLRGKAFCKGWRQAGGVDCEDCWPKEAE